MVERDNEETSIARQCELLGLRRSGFYYTPIVESAYNLELMNCIDEQYMKSPFYGMMTDRKLIMWLRKKYKIGYRKAVEKLNSIRQSNPEMLYHWKMGYR